MLVCGSSLVHAHPEVDEAEILRLGNVVQSVGSGVQSTDVDQYVEALAPPESDADKWFISVVTAHGCKTCEQLKRDWNTDPWLQAIANPDDPNESWSHFNVYVDGDRSQAFRFENVRITDFPTVIVQPPRSGKYGDPKTVVFQAVYQSSPRRLTEAITQAIGQYVSRLKPNADNQDGAGHGQNYAPPWQPAPKDDRDGQSPPGKADRLDRLLQLIPPKPEPVSFPWSMIVSVLSAGVSLPSALTVLVCTLQSIRTRREAAEHSTSTEPAKLDRLLELLQSLVEPSRPPAGSADP
jgi:hypothetical protein